MNKFVRRLVTEWRRLELPFDGAKIVVAVSGGGDSTALLLALGDLARRGKLKNQFVVAHFDHGLRTATEASADASFVAGLADRFGFGFRTEKGVVAKKGNLEQNARRARYAFLRRVAESDNASFVVVGHTLDDQAETVLMNLIRGAGVDGLAGMSPKSTVEGIAVVRPLLSWATRDSTSDFCSENDFVPRPDAMNEDLRFTRVRVRKQLIPLLETFNPKVVEAIARTAATIPSEVENEKVDRISVASIRALDDPAAARLVRSWLTALRGSARSLGAAHVAAVVKLTRSPKSGRVVELPGGERVTKKGGRLEFWSEPR